MNICTTEVNEIEGIGPATAEDLSAIGIDYLFDFLLYSPSFLASQTSFSFDQFEEWRVNALFLELDGMDKQIAEALVESKVVDPEHLSMLEFGELRTKIHDSLADDAVDSLPSDSLIAAIQVDATRAVYGRQVQGRVMDEFGRPIANVSVRVGAHEMLSNSKGYWRVTKLNNVSSVKVIAIMEGYESVLVEEVVPETDMYSNELLAITMSEGDSHPIILDEFTGDDLGSLVSYATDEVNLSEDDLRDGDLFRVSYHYVNGDIKLVSVYLSLNNETLQIPCFRVSGEHFEDKPEILSFWSYKNGVLEPSSVTEGTLQITKAVHKHLVRNMSTEKLTMEEAMGTPFTIHL